MSELSRLGWQLIAFVVMLVMILAGCTVLIMRDAQQVQHTSTPGCLIGCDAGSGATSATDAASGAAVDSNVLQGPTLQRSRR